MINLIAAISQTNQLGYQNKLLTKLPNDLKRFKQLTDNSIVVQGRKTYESIIAVNKRSLPNRTNLVLSRDSNYQTLNGDTDIVYEFQDLMNEYYELAEPSTNLWIIGGNEVYEQFLPYCDRIYLTIIHHNFNHCDTWFPKFDHRKFKVVTSETKHHYKDDKHDYDYSFMTLERRKPTYRFK